MGVGFNRLGEFRVEAESLLKLIVSLFVFVNPFLDNREPFVYAAFFHVGSLLIKLVKAEWGKHKLTKGVVLIAFSDRYQSPAEAACDAEFTEPRHRQDISQMEVVF